jgi:hypothetical protein
MQDGVHDLQAYNPCKPEVHIRLSNEGKRHFGINLWCTSTCTSLSRRVLELAFQVSISLDYGPFGNLNKSNQIRLCRFLTNRLPVLDLKIREKCLWDRV